MRMNGDNEFQAKSAAAAGQRRQLHARSSKFIKFPFEVRIDGAPHDQYYDLRDATASARSPNVKIQAHAGFRGDGATIASTSAVSSAFLRFLALCTNWKNAR
jgi:hypothetical protein